MLRSMTGFARHTNEDADFAYTWEVRSVNGKYLDLKWRMPLQFRGAEPRLEKTVRSHAQRGRVEISLSVQSKSGLSSGVNFDKVQAGACLDALTAFAKSRGDSYAPDYSRLLGLSSLWNLQAEDDNEARLLCLEGGLGEVMAQWNRSREKEGLALAEDITQRLTTMAAWLSNIAAEAPKVKEDRLAQLRARLEDMLQAMNSGLDENRFLQELVIAADKLDVSEEITRLGIHMERLQELLNGGKDAGRKLDFTLQEAFREINTCGNKIQDARVSRMVVDMKNELEKCREQVQNLE